MESFDIEQAIVYAKLADLAFSSKETIQKDIRRYGFEYFKEISNEKTDVGLYIAEGHRSILICFKGSRSEKNFFSDVNLLFTEYPQVRRILFKPKVHSGFLSAYESIKNDVYSAIDELRRITGKILPTIEIVGYSLGAAIGGLLSFDMIQDRKETVHFTGFAVPRFGNRWFVRRYNSIVKNSWVIQNDKDIVGHLPPKALGYRHVNKIVLIDGSNRLIFSPNAFEKLGSTLESSIKLVELESLNEHLLSTYVSRLEAIKQLKKS